MIYFLREFVKLPSSWPPARVEGESGQQSMTMIAGIRGIRGIRGLFPEACY